MTMSKVFGDLIIISALIYVDDIIVYSSSYEQHLKDLEQVFNRLFNSIQFKIVYFQHNT